MKQQQNQIQMQQWMNQTLPMRVEGGSGGSQDQIINAEAVSKKLKQGQQFRPGNLTRQEVLSNYIHSGTNNGVPIYMGIGNAHNTNQIITNSSSF